MSPSLSNSGGKNSSDSSPSHWSYSQSSIKSTPTTVENTLTGDDDEYCDQVLLFNLSSETRKLDKVDHIEHMISLFKLNIL
ncbi:hypothetical protein MKW92_033052 [Papaver armeniacum]|nr:hypothetical protein MKW92_033052 [Papaver armeniacum]